MANYFVRLEIHEAGPTELQHIHASLAAAKIYRFFISKNNSFWQFPDGLYRTDAESMAAVSSSISKALSRFQKQGEFVIIESTDMITKGLRPITREQAILLNKGEEA